MLLYQPSHGEDMFLLTISALDVYGMYTDLCFNFPTLLMFIPYHSEVGIIGSIIDLYAHDQHYDKDQNIRRTL